MHACLLAVEFLLMDGLPKKSSIFCRFEFFFGPRVCGATKQSKKVMKTLPGPNLSNCNRSGHSKGYL